GTDLPVESSNDRTEARAVSLRYARGALETSALRRETRAPAAHIHYGAVRLQELRLLLPRACLAAWLPVRVAARGRRRVRGRRRRHAAVPHHHRGAVEREARDRRDAEVRMHVGMPARRERGLV